MAQAHELDIRQNVSPVARLEMLHEPPRQKRALAAPPTAEDSAAGSNPITTGEAISPLPPVTPDGKLGGAGPSSRRTRRLIGAIVAAAVLLVAGLWIAAFVLIGSEERTAISNARINISNLSAAFQEELTHEFDDISDAMNLVARRMVAAPGVPDLHAWAADLSLLSSLAVQAAIVGPDGHLRTTTDDAHPAPIDLSNLPYFRSLLDPSQKGLFIKEALASHAGGTPTITVSRRVDAPDGRFLGVIVFSLAPGRLTELHRAIDLGTGGILTVLDTGNVILARFGAASPDGTADIGKMVPSVPARLRTGDLHDTIHIAESRIDHVRRLFSDRRLEHYPLIVGVGLPMAQIMGPVWVGSRQIEFSAAAVSLLLCALLTALIGEIRRRGMHEGQLALERSALAADIALRQEVERRLRESEQKFQDIAEVSGDWIWETGADHRFTFIAADAYNETTRLTESMTIGRTRWELAGVDPAQDDNWRRHKEDLDAHLPFRMFRYQAPVANGAFRHFAVSGKPVFGPDGAFLGYRGTASNETPIVEARQRAEQAETLLRDAIDNLAEGFVIFDRDDRLVLCNEAYRRMYPASAHLMVPGVKFETLVRNTLASGHYPDAAGQEEVWVQNFLRIHRDAIGELETQQRDGRWVLVSERRMSNGGLAGLRVDITESKRIQNAVLESERRLRDFAEMASDWFWEQAADGTFSWVSVSNRATDVPSSFYVGRTRWDLYPDGATPQQWEAHRAVLTARQPFQDFRYHRADSSGRLRHISIHGVPIFDDDGTFAGYRGVGRDITEQIVAAQELQQAKERAEQAETLLRDAVDSMSEGFVIYDADERMVMCNEAYRQIYPNAGYDLVSGLRFEDVIRRIHEMNDGAVDRFGNEPEWAAERLRHFREGTGSLEYQMTNGIWVLLSDRRMKNGGVAGLRINITALKQAQAALRESEARLDRAQQIAHIGSWELEVATGRYIWSKELYRIRGVSPETFEPDIENVAQYVHADDYPAVRRWLSKLVAGVEQNALEPRIIRPDGEVRVLRVEGRPVVDPDNRVRRVAGTMQDITERRLIERQLAQAQKMEAIGSLTGGMAHDFNNVLGIIIGNLDLLKRLVGEEAAAAELCSEALDGATRCTELVRRLLAFARRQSLHPELTDVNALVGDIARLLGRVLGDDITLNLQLDPALHPVMADPAQLEAAIVNFATNARDAMPQGGRLDIITRNAVLDETFVGRHPDVAPGAYVEIEIADTGSGISPDIINRIFEPFFTTKAPGKGTGLGLSMAFGFVKQSGGHLSVYSEPDLGTTFRLYLPSRADNDAPLARPAEVGTVAGGDETVLLVEDNERLRHATARQLVELGYQVIEAEHADAALAALTGGAAPDLLFSDVVMPGTMDGLNLARRATALRPGLKVLLTSGFPGARGANQPLVECPFSLLNKPYRRDTLARALRAALDNGKVPAGRRAPPRNGENPKGERLVATDRT